MFLATNNFSDERSITKEGIENIEISQDSLDFYIAIHWQDRDLCRSEDITQEGMTFLKYPRNPVPIVRRLMLENAIK